MIKKMINFIFVALFSLCSVQTFASAPDSDWPQAYDVVWQSPSKDYNGSMPIGNGDIGANVWVEEGGDLLFYISKTDAWSENASLLKLGKIRIRFTPNLFEKGCNFSQKLNLEDGVIEINSESMSAETSVSLKFWVDANYPVIRIAGESSKDVSVEIILEHWRNERKEVVSGNRLFYGLFKGRSYAYPLFIEPDTIVDTEDDTIVWYHRNKELERSVWEDTLTNQRLEGYMKKSTDPLANRTFGALVEADGFISESASVLKSAKPAKKLDVSIFPLTAQTPTAEEWIAEVQAQAKTYQEKSSKSQWAEHTKWWNEFWDRSWINIPANAGEDAHIVARGYALQNWVSACGGRGNMPIKFNGSIFTVDGPNGDPDYRAWGPCFWWQNTRLSYWPMLAAGNYDMMKPLFKMYLDALPLQRYRIKEYYGFEGAYFPETMYFWGTYNNQNFGWNNPKDWHPDRIKGRHTQYEWQGGIELTAMMLQYYRQSLDEEFLKQAVLPFAKEIVTFYDKRYKRNDEGKLVIHPANALEDVWNCTNPTPEIAGLKFILPQLIELTPNSAHKKQYTRFLKEIPDLEMDVSDAGKKYILPARKGVERRGNCEKPECYAIFPYRLFGVGLPDLGIARETFKLSPRTRSNGWVQDAMFAACIGDTDEAAKLLVKRSKEIHQASRFQGFWTPAYAWVPNQDHGGVNTAALQLMLLQTEPYSEKIHLFPAWPKEWDVDFKLHAPGKTIVQGKLKDGKLLDLKVTPKERKKDIINHFESSSN